MTTCQHCLTSPDTYCAGRFAAERFLANERMEQWLRKGPPGDLDATLRMNLGVYAELRQAAADHDQL